MNAFNCNICERRCRLSDGRQGACGLYKAEGNRIVERFGGSYLAACPISIETMPIVHYYPGAKFLQISTTGCNFDCPGCISTCLVKELSPDSPALLNLSAKEIVERAVAEQCTGIAFLMNDPIAAMPRFLQIAQLAHEEGLKAGCSSNAYFTPEILHELLPRLDFINVGMKGFSDKSYRDCGVPAIGPVLRNLKTLHDAGVHVEISCILTRENQSELMDLARWIAEIDPDIPLQVMRFLPFESAAIDREPTIFAAEKFCADLSGILNFVYLFNTPGSEFLHTGCPQCGRVCLRREFYGPMGAKLRPPQGDSLEVDRCPACGYPLPIKGAMASAAHQEKDFEGGYPLTRAMEMVQAMLIAVGVDAKEKVVRAWEELLQKDGLKRLHQGIQDPVSYIEVLDYFGQNAGAAGRTRELTAYLYGQLMRIENDLATVSRKPKVYYAMGKPLFYLNGGRLENQLVEFGGGISLNKQLPPGGRPGRSISVGQLNELNPDIILISAFLSNPVDDFYRECTALGITARAVTEKKIYAHPAPGWDFGSPRWILGLLYMAGLFHPEHCRYDVMAEARIFYRRFYGMDFSPARINRSFAKPSDNWGWNSVREEF